MRSLECVFAVRVASWDPNDDRWKDRADLVEMYPHTSVALDQNTVVIAGVVKFVVQLY